MEDYLQMISAFKIRRSAAISQHQIAKIAKRRSIIKNWIQSVGKLTDAYVRALEIYRPPQKRLKAHYRALEVGNDLLTKLNDDRFWQEFRISRGKFHYICNALRTDLEPQPNLISGNQRQATVEEKVAVCLYKLKSCSEYQVTGNVFGFGKSTVHKFFYQVVRAIIKNLTPIHIKMPSLEEAQKIAGEFYKVTGINQILGAIDCTHIPVTAPLEGGKDFLNRKGWTSIVLQAVVDHDYRFLDISCNFPGNVHDAVVLKGSQLFHRQNQLFPASNWSIDNVNIPYLLLGDPAYPLLPWIMKDFPGRSLEDSKQLFNFKLNRGRVKVEQSFGILKKCWRILSRRSEIDTNFMPLVVAACCTLHNIIREELPTQVPSDEAHSSEILPNQITETVLPAAEAIRNAIANKLYAENVLQ